MANPLQQIREGAIGSYDGSVHPQMCWAIAFPSGRGRQQPARPITWRDLVQFGGPLPCR